MATSWIEMGDDLATRAATEAYLRLTGLGAPKVRALHDYLLQRTGMHMTSDLARAFEVSSQTILRRLRVLLRAGLVTRVAGEGRRGEPVGGRECALWSAVHGESIDQLVASRVGNVSMGAWLSTQAPKEPHDA